MLDLKFIRESTDLVRENIIAKNEKVDLNELVSIDENRRSIIAEVEQLKNLRNIVSNEIAQLKRQKLDAAEKIASMKDVSDKIKSLDDELRQIEESLSNILLRIPNMAHNSVPHGKSAEDNVTVRSWETPAESPTGLNHIEIGKKLGIIDFERGAKVSGAGFYYFVGKGAALERALISFMLDIHTKNNGYTEVFAPFAVSQAAMKGVGQLPKMADDMYYVQNDDLYLIPTAEVPLTYFRSNEMLKIEELPIKICGYSPCFRREAGSYGKEVHGLLRVHQFNKVELVKFVLPETSYDELESLTQNAEEIVQMLGLPYRILLLCTGDTSFASAKTYDIEVWAPGEKKWLEVSSCSNFADFQSRRSNIRFKREAASKPEFVHTLNGSALATPRIMASLLEMRYDGERFPVPESLQKYCGFEYI